MSRALAKRMRTLILPVLLAATAALGAEPRR